MYLHSFKTLVDNSFHFYQEKNLITAKQVGSESTL